MAILEPINNSDIERLKTAGNDHKKSEILCRMAIVAYCKSEAEIHTALGGGWSGIVTWLDSDIRNQGYIAWADGVVVVAFRGTDSRSDWQSNANAFWPDRHPLGGRRHNGFQQVWNELASEVRSGLTNDVASGSQLWLTGHSLGGAVATAAAAEFLVDQPSRITAGFNIVTFGAPRFGNLSFQQASDARVQDRHWFYANARDPVPHLGPAWMGYRHGGVLKYFNKDGRYLAVRKDQVGLQVNDNTPEAEAAFQWLLVDADIDAQARTQAELEQLVEEISHGASEPQLTTTDDGVAIEVPNGELQGDSVWTSAAHDSALYWKRIRELAS